MLFGTNAVGKSSLIRAIGMTIVLAQAGFFVPCSSLHFKPYTSVFTRILGNQMGGLLPKYNDNKDGDHHQKSIFTKVSEELLHKNLNSTNKMTSSYDLIVNDNYLSRIQEKGNAKDTKLKLNDFEQRNKEYLENQIIIIKL